MTKNFYEADYMTVRSGETKGTVHFRMIGDEKSETVMMKDLTIEEAIKVRDLLDRMINGEFIP